METSPATRGFDLNLIRVLDAVISAGNATKASKRLNVTPAAVSLALQRLQHTYNEALFVRTKDGLAPTARAREIHHTFVQVLNLVDTTFHTVEWEKMHKEIVICGNDITEQYFLSQIIDFEIFEHYLVHHRTNWSREAIASREMLVTGAADLILTFEPPRDRDFNMMVIERFKNFCVVCGQRNPLSSLSKITLHSFYSFHHAVIRNDVFNSVIFDEKQIIMSTGPYSGRRLIGYRSETLTGLLSMVEHSSMIAVIPLPLANYFKSHRKYAISVMSLPDEINIRPLALHAVWSRKNKLEKDLSLLVSMLQTVASFRK
ncbi:MAG TPA: LysR family transcriptional regulator [Scandinavium sp.]|jgi:DNA-binding transcriptional LysR family regulator|uniref:LysR family transcriptional regulator n=1 Tax=Scandinavium sp. TaxID=2830653 RepID=UPI002E30AB71|nr:LysR family transcriptional regulator [Scandinavium sp.]HEX4499682.1 LysR family transcriptional regulator [Scandinavium sp.]